MIGPDKKLKLSILYPATTGRNFDEILRVVDSLQLTAHNCVATPVDWRVSLVCLESVCSCHQCVMSNAHICSCLKPGDSVMVPPSIPEQEAMTLFPAGVYTKDLPSGKKYLRYTPQPNPISSDCTDGWCVDSVMLCVRAAVRKTLFSSEEAQGFIVMFFFY